MRWRGRLMLIFVLMVPLLAVGMAKAGWILYTGGPYQGQVVDAETRQPVEGAVVFFHWKRHVYGGAGGPVSFFLKAVEVLTDKEGRFYVPWFIGTSLNPFSLVLEPTWFAYYPGYDPDRVIVTPPTGVMLRDPTVILQRKLRTREERLKVVRGLPPGGVPDEAMPNLIRLMNIEATALGLQPSHVRSGGRR